MGTVVETPLTLRLSDSARTRLMERAAQSGRDVSAVASDLLERAIAGEDVEALLAPFRKQVAESGLSDEQLDDCLRGELQVLPDRT